MTIKTLHAKSTNSLIARLLDVTEGGSVAIFGCGRAKRLIGSGGRLRRHELEPFADKLNCLGQS